MTRTAIGLVLLALTALAVAAQEKSVRPGINDPFKDPDVKEFQGKFEVESREVYTQREKIVAAVARRFVCIGDESKLVPVLGRFPLPVEVIPVARSYVARQLVLLGGQPAWRMGFTTDNGNLILDVSGLKITNPVALETAINQIAGVVTVGLFARRGADVILLGTETGVRTLVPGKPQTHP